MDLTKREFNFIYINTADGCVRMILASPTWDPLPNIILPLVFPPEIKDWVQEEIRDDQVSYIASTRRYRLEREDIMQDGKTKLFTYREMRN